MSRRLLATLLLLLGLSPARSQRDEGRAESARRVWASLAPERRELVLRNYRRYLAMSAEERALLRRRYRLFLSLPRQRREELLRNWRTFRSLPAQQQRELRRLRGPAGAKARGTPARSRERAGGRDRGGRSPAERHGSRERGGPFHRR